MIIKLLNFSLKAIVRIFFFLFFAYIFGIYKMLSPLQGQGILIVGLVGALFGGLSFYLYTRIWIYTKRIDVSKISSIIKRLKKSNEKDVATKSTLFGYKFSIPKFLKSSKFYFRLVAVIISLLIIYAMFGWVEKKYHEHKRDEYINYVTENCEYQYNQSNFSPAVYIPTLEKRRDDFPFYKPIKYYNKDSIPLSEIAKKFNITYDFLIEYSGIDNKWEFEIKYFENAPYYIWNGYKGFNKTDFIGGQPCRDTLIVPQLDSIYLSNYSSFLDSLIIDRDYSLTKGYLEFIGGYNDYSHKLVGTEELQKMDLYPMRILIFGEINNLTIYKFHTLLEFELVFKLNDNKQKLMDLEFGNPDNYILMNHRWYDKPRRNYRFSNNRIIRFPVPTLNEYTCKQHGGTLLYNIGEWEYCGFGYSLIYRNTNEKVIFKGSGLPDINFSLDIDELIRSFSSIEKFYIEELPYLNDSEKEYWEKYKPIIYDK